MSNRPSYHFFTWLATFIGSHVGLYREGQTAGFIMSLVGALVLLAIYRLIKGRAKPV